MTISQYVGGALMFLITFGFIGYQAGVKAALTGLLIMLAMTFSAWLFMGGLK